MKFLFKLARLWGCPVSEVRERLDTDELPYWIAEYELDPWGDYREDVRQGVSAAAVCSAFLGERISPADLIHVWDQGETAPQAPVHDQELGLAAWKAFVARHNGTGTSKGESGSK